MEFQPIALDAVIFSALLKLTSSADDLLWLPPYASAGRKTLTALQYTVTLLGVVLLAFALAQAGTWLIQDETYLNVGAGVLLMAFALFYLRREHDLGGRGVIGITFLGSLDELGIFTGLFAGRLVGLESALIGTLLAALAVVTAVEAFSRIAPVMRILNKLPVWLVILAVGFWMSVEGFIHGQ